ncbi:putative holin-like toxin [Lutispora saccharofermentans]|uniref:Holin-like toxin n=1 Tax=Lutispora saccharofermentans TaxID=3024236 RepID=A0ABT1ND09_9FIRM|nr:putative holin-like toxin [Lutispora saccharofermentans]
MNTYEALILMLTFGLFIVALLSLIIAIFTKRK